MMRIHDLKDEQGRVFAFEIDNLWMDRTSVGAVVTSIPGAELRDLHRSWWGPDEFCEFVLHGKTFVVWEPWGDNSRYWVGPSPPEFTEHIDAVRATFARHTPRSSNLLRGAVTLVCIGILAMTLGRHIGWLAWIPGAGAVTFLIGSAAGALAIALRLRGVRT